MDFSKEIISQLEAAVKKSELEIDDPAKKEKIERTLCGLHLGAEQVVHIQRVFHDEMEKGIRGEPSSLQMENTYIPELPDGTEQGQFLALDLGGTNFRVILLELTGGRVISERVQHYHVTKALRLGDGEALFDFLAESIGSFVKDQGLSTSERLPLGFTFSFPMRQKGLDVGVLVTWTKTFNCASTVGNDAVAMLRAALERQGHTNIEVLAILNDTTGTLIQGAVMDPRTAVGLILGTGTNACYFEKASRVQHWEGERHGEKEVIVDIEWGAFGDNGVLDFIKTEFDKQVDSTSIIEGSFTFEKYISGKYLGEVVRVILVRLAEECVAFADSNLNLLADHGAFTTAFVSRIEQDTVMGETGNTEEILQLLGLQFTLQDIRLVQYVCHVVSFRAALLVSICLATLIQRVDREDASIAVDGSLFKHHPRLRIWMEKLIGMMVPNKKFQLLLAEDGSGKGAGIVAAIALRLRKRFAGEKHL